MQGTFLLMAVSVRSVGLWSSVGLCTLGIKILQVALRCLSHRSHIAFTLICFIFICFFSSFFCSRRKAASCRQGHRDWNEHGWALQRASWSFWKNQTTKKPSSTWVHISNRMSWLLTGCLHVSETGSTYPDSLISYGLEGRQKLAVAGIPTCSPGDTIGEISQ